MQIYRKYFKLVQIYVKYLYLVLKTEMLDVRSISNSQGFAPSEALTD